ncbi:MAG: 30S ribosomal protein S8 [Halobacteriovoraceae bacterium]|nr:30S ribosomal protein S8 [Halobacteriovoraceae bacterium]
MMMTDPVSDMLTRIRNGARANHLKVDMPASRIKANVCKVLKEEGFIKNFKVLVKDNNLTLRIALKEQAIVDIQRVSKPGLRIYKGYRDMPRILSGLGVSIVSTSSGIVSSRKAKAMKLGGEVLCNVW